MVKRILIFILFYSISGYCISQKTEIDTLHSDSIYLLIRNNSLVEIENNDFKDIGYYLVYHFIKDDYTLILEYYKNNKLRSILGRNEEYEMGVAFRLSSDGDLCSLIFKFMGREAGPEIEVYPNHLLKSYFNYGFNMTDINIPLKVKKRIVDLEGLRLTLNEEYYKAKNGSMYYYDLSGNNVIDAVLFREGEPLTH